MGVTRDKYERASDFLRNWRHGSGCLTFLQSPLKWNMCCHNEILHLSKAHKQEPCHQLLSLVCDQEPRTFFSSVWGSTHFFIAHFLAVIYMHTCMHTHSDTYYYYTLIKPACFWTVRGNWRTWKKPKRTWGQHWKFCRDKNPIEEPGAEIWWRYLQLAETKTQAKIEAKTHLPEALLHPNLHWVGNVSCVQLMKL